LEAYKRPAWYFEAKERWRVSMNISERLRIVELALKGEWSGLFQLKEILEAELMEELNRKLGTTDLFKFAKKFIKGCDKNRPEFTGLMEQNSKYYLCDGYRAFEFDKDIVGIDKIPAPINFEGLMDLDVSITLDVKDLKFTCAKHKALETNTPVIYEGYGFNACNILDALSLIKDPIFMVAPNNHYPALVTGSNGIRAMILPFRIDEPEPEE
jgi:hypothetical protein